MIEKGVNVLSHVTRWEDPYEAFLLRAEIEAAAEASEDELEASVFDRYKFVYGQSWSLYADESELRWRAYCPNCDGVRIETTLGQLSNGLSKSLQTSSGEIVKKYGSSYIGKVEYLPQREFDALLTPERLAVFNDATLEENMRMFFVKRNEFSEENEVRVVMCPNEEALDKKRDTDGSLLMISIDPAELISSVLVDPRMSRRDYQQIVCRLRYRYPTIRIKQSRLYNWPHAATVFAADAPVQRGAVVDENSNVRFWRMTQTRFDPKDPVARHFDLCHRTVSDKGDWDLGLQNGFHCRLTFNSTGARINVYAYNEADVRTLRQQCGDFRQRFPTADIDEKPLFSGGVRFALYKRDVRLGDKATWAEACAWLVENTCLFYRFMCEIA